jgi:beta-lactamase class A
MLLLAPGVPLSAQQAGPALSIDRDLQAGLEALAREFHGDVGVYVRQLRTGRGAALRADEVFPTASMIKVPILAALYDRLDRGELRVDSMLVYTDSLIDPEESDMLGSFRDSTRVELGRVIMLMLTMSDNTAALWNQSLAGTGTAINQWLARNGFDSTRVNSRTPGREEARRTYGWGQTTPREMAELLVRIREGRAVSPAASQEMYRDLTRSYWNGEALSQLPPWVQAASKQGAVDASRSEVVLVNAPSGDYVFCVITRNQQDRSWQHDNEGFVLLRRISALLWKTFEPAHRWAPAPGADRFKPRDD